MGAMSKLELPNPNEAIDLAYTFHSADDPTIAGTLDQELCRKEAKHFLARVAKSGTPEEAYLRSIGPIIHTYCRALTRSKQQLDRKIEAADTLLEAELARLTSGTISLKALTLGLRFLQPAIVVVGGLLAARVLGKVVPDSFSDATGTGLPTFLIVGVGLASWQVSTQRFNQIARSKAFLRHREEWLKASIAGEEYKLAHLMIVWDNLLGAWKQYTGQKFSRHVYYKTQMETNLINFNREYEKTRLKSQGILKRLVILVAESISAVTRKVMRLGQNRSVKRRNQIEAE